MIDFNLGEKYLDRFVQTGSNDEEQGIYNFTEFSDFGKDHLWQPAKESELTYDDIASWAKETMQDTYEDATPEVSDDNLESDSEYYVTSDPVANPDVSKFEVTDSVTTSNKFDVSKAINRLHYLANYDISNNDPKKWTKKGTHEKKRNCARAVRMAMEAGGLSTKGRPRYGGNYGPYLLSHGWEQLPNDTIPQAGDVCVTHGLGKEGWGHISMYDGSKWISDFVQNSYKVFKGTKLGVNTHFYRYTG